SAPKRNVKKLRLPTRACIGMSDPSQSAGAEQPCGEESQGEHDDQEGYHVLDAGVHIACRELLEESEQEATQNRAPDAGASPHHRRRQSLDEENEADIGIE